MTKLNNTILHIEGLAVFLASLYFYNQTGYSWWWFGLFLLFDISMIGYAMNKKAGAYTYNIGHSYVLPVLLTIFAVNADNTLLTVISILWFAHIGFDRAQGYGLKEERGFTHTHLGRIGKSRKQFNN